MAFRPQDSVLPNPAVPINLNDDVALVFGTGSDASLVWDTADANSNVLKLGLPDGNATDSSTFVVGRESAIVGTDLGWWNGETEPGIALVRAAGDKYASLRWAGTYFNFSSDGPASQYLFVPTLNTNQVIQASDTLYILGSSTAMQMKRNTVFGDDDFRMAFTTHPFVMTNTASINTDFGKGVQTRPILYLTSETALSTSTAEWISFSHDTDNAVIGVGTGLLDVSSTGSKVGVTTVNAATYDLLVTDYILHVTYTGTGAVTSLTLPSAQVVSGRVIHIKDAGGNAGTNNITIDTEGSETIDGSATAVINSNYSAYSLYSDGSNWFVIAVV